MLEMRLEGPPYEIGLQYGRQVAGLAGAFWDRLFQPIENDTRFARFSGRPELVPLICRRIEGNLSQRIPQLVQELQGFAAGTGLPYEKVLQLTFFDEVSAEVSAALLQRCTDLAVCRGPEGTLALKNSDYDAGDRRFVILQWIYPDQGIPFVQTNWAAGLWTDAAVNEAGLVYSGASLVPTRENWDGLPPNTVLRWMIQNCRTVPEAIDFLAGYDFVRTGLHVLLADAHGGLAVVEKVPTCQATRWPDARGIVFNGNHSLLPAVAASTGGSQELLANSHARVDNLRQLVQQVPLTLEGLQRIAADHHEPGAICQHGQAHLYTEASYIMSPGERALWVAQGPPCQNPYVRYSI